MKRRILSMLLVLSMILSCIVIAQADETGIKINAPSYARPGENINVSVVLPENTEFYNGSFNLNYDNTVLELVSGTVGDALADANATLNTAYTSSKIRLSWMSDDVISGGTALNLIFKVVSGATGATTFEIEKFKLYDDNYDSVYTPESTSTKLYIINESEMKIALSCDKTATTGSTVTATVDIADAMDVCGGSFNMVYDAEKMSVSTVKAGSMLSAYSKQINKNYAENKIRFTWAGTSAISGSGTLLTVVFNVNNGVSGNADLVIEKLKLADADGKALECVSSNNSTEITCNHSQMDWQTVIPATCTEDGSESYSCGCGYATDTRVIPKTGHKLMDWVVTTEATCEADGVQEYTCLRCGFVEKTEIIPKHDHVYTDKVVEPTKKDDGYTEHTCKDCGTSYKDTYTDATGYVISFNANGGENPPQNQIKKYGESIILSSVVPTRNGYTFLGWAKSADSKETEYFADGEYAEDEDLSLYAVWSINKHTVTYMVDGNEYAVQSYDFGKLIEAVDEPTKEGYTFSGWDEIPITMPDSDVVVSGTFSINTYKVSFDLNGGNGDFEEIDAEYNSEVSVPSDIPTKANAGFIGWATKKTAKKAEYMPEDKVTITGDLTLFAVWSEIWTGGKSDKLSGRGTKTSPYIIASAEDLAFMRDKVNEGDPAYHSAYYIQTNNIVLNDTSNVDNWDTQAPANEWVPIGLVTEEVTRAFMGVFDGNGYTISGLYINKPIHEESEREITSPNEHNILGLFGLVSSLEEGDYNIKISNVSLTSGYVNGGNYIGGLIGSLQGGEVQNCKSNVSVNGFYWSTGGLFGANFSIFDDVTIKNCESNGKVNGVNAVGGIAGTVGIKTYDITYDNCTNNSIVCAEGEKVGGIIGNAYSDVFRKKIIGTKLINSGNVEGTKIVAGIVGSGKYIEIVKSSNIGNILLHWQTGAGIIGQAINSNILQCKNVGNVTADMLKQQNGWSAIGGICGAIEYGSISLSYNVGNISSLGTDNAGICGCISYNSLVDRCCNAGNVSSTGTTAGIAACTINNGSITLALNTGNITGVGFCAGITAYFENVGSANCCINIGNVRTTSSTTNCMAIGYSTGVITNCYYLNTCGASGPGTALTQEQMRNGASYVGFTDTTKWTYHFSDNWIMGNNPYTCFPMLKGIDNLAAQPIEFDLHGGYFDDYVYSARTYATALNSKRVADNLIIYNNSNTSTGANDKAGVEVLVNDRGIVIAKSLFTDAVTVPNGGFVLSGHSIMAFWLNDNIEIGDKVTYDSNNLEVKVYKKNPVFTYAYGHITYLPTPHKEGYVFSGWYDEDNNLITNATTINHIGTLKVHAKWSQPKKDNEGTYNGNTYIVFNQPTAWASAEKYCEELGGHLATISDENENAYIKSLIKDTNVSYIIGGNDFDTEGSFKWITGEPMSYTNWNSGEPNDSNPGEDIIVIRSDGLWNDHKETYISNVGFICEIENLTPVGSTVYNGHYYQVFNKHFNWQQAEAYCEQIGGHLATITSAEEQAVIKALAENQAQQYYWLGATDEKVEGKWEWITGEEWNYSNWRMGQPDNSHGTEHYLHMYTKVVSTDYYGTWNDLPLTYDGTLGFICEFDSMEPIATVEHNGHTYKLFDTSLSWNDANKYCESIGGYLATVTSEDEQNYIYENLIKDNAGKAYYRLGGHGNGSTWVWDTGEAFDYSNWSTGEPSNAPTTSRFIGMYSSLAPEKIRNTCEPSKWFDIANYSTTDWNAQKSGFICEYDAENDIKVGDYLQMGTYYDEPILWRCVSVDENGPLMMSDKIISLKPYDAGGNNTSGSHGRGYYYDGRQGNSRILYGSNYWADSNIRDWLNSNETTENIVWSCGNVPNTDNIWYGHNNYDDEDGFLTGFSKSEINVMKPVSQKNILDAYEFSDSNNVANSNYHKYEANISNVLQNYDTACSENVMDTVFLPDVKQIYNVWQNGHILGADYYIGELTAQAVKHSNVIDDSIVTGTKWYAWLRTPLFGTSDRVRYVDKDGEIGSHYAAWDGRIGIRPAFYLNTSVNDKMDGSGTAGIPYVIKEKAFRSIVDSGKCGEDVTYTLYDDGELVIEGNGDMTDWQNSSAKPWNIYKDDIKTVLIKDGVTSVGAFAFYECVNVEKVDLPNFMNKIGNNAFYKCLSLKEFEVPNGVTAISNNAFYGCSGLISINIPNYVKSIGKQAFGECGKLNTIVISDNVTTIGDYAFVNCYSLSAIDLPKQLNKIGTGLFVGCKGLTTIDIPNSVVSVGIGAFDNCENLKSIVVSNSVKNINTSAFYKCDSLTDIYYEGSETDWKLIDIYSNNMQYINAATIHYNYVRYKNTYMISYDGEETETVEENSKVIIKDNTTQREGYTFLGWSTTENATEAEYVVGDELIVTSNVTLYSVWKKNEIEPTPTHDNWSLDNGVLTIKNTADLEHFTFSELPEWNENASEIDEVVVSDGIKTIGGYSFYKLPNVTTVDLADSVKTIGDYAFSNCSSLSSINLNNIDTFGDYAFRFCTGLESIELSANKTYGKGVFSGCGDVNKVVINKGVTKIGDILSGCHASTIEFDGTKAEFDRLYSTSVNFTYDNVLCKADGNIYPSNSDDDNYVAVSKLTLDKKSLGLKVGETKQLNVSIEPTEATNKKVTWKSSNESFVTVDENGIVTAIAEGATEIICMSENEAIESACIVYVTKDTEAPVILSSNAKGRPGQQVEVEISMENNPGIVSARLNVEYNKKALELVEVKDGGILGNKMHSADLTASPYVLYWDNGAAKENITTNGTLATLVFEIKDTASGGEYPITVSCGSKDIINYQLTPIQFNAYSSVVDVYNFIYGDVNDDDDVDTIDSALLARFIGKWANININSQAADVNNDSRINTLDSAILKRHIANWTGYEELPYLPSASLMALNSQKGKVTADSVMANAGDEVSVGVTLSDNPGIISMKLDIDYDSDALELVDVIDNGIIPGQTHSDDLTTIPYTLYWDNGDSADNYNANGNLVNLIFRVKDSAKLGEYPISLLYDAENSDIIDSSLNAVQFDIQSGSVKVNAKENKIIISDLTVSENVGFKCNVEAVDTIKGQIAVASYNLNDKLITLKLFDASESIDVTLGKNNADYVKVFWWDMVSLMPYAKAERIELK